MQGSGARGRDGVGDMSDGMSPTRRRPNIFSMLRYKAIKNTHIRCSPAAMLAVPSEVMKSDGSSSSEREALELAAWPERC